MGSRLLSLYYIIINDDIHSASFSSIYNSAEQTSGTFNQETTAPITTAAMNTESNSFSGASTLSGAAIGGIVACLALLLILFTSIIGGYCLYRSVHKKSGKYSPKESKQEIGMTLTFKNGRNLTV